MKLGQTVNQIRSGSNYKDHRDELESIGFDFSSSSARGFAAVKTALLKYKEIHGDMLVPVRFTLPSHDFSWPKEIWGTKLGAVVSQIRAGNNYREHREELESIGFDYSPQVIVYGYVLAKSALLKYKEIHGDMLVKTSFIVPADDLTWPEETWGMKLGATMSQIRSGNIFRDHHDELESIGFDFSSSSDRCLAAVCAALVKFKDLFGNMLVSALFTIPADDDSWPKCTRGMNLGAVVHKIRADNRYIGHRSQLESIGFEYNPRMRVYRYASVKAALLTYMDIYDNLLVPSAFTIPVDDYWPEKTWGMRLGATVHQIRAGYAYKDHRKELESIGFDYSSELKGFGFASIKSALLKYEEIHGDMAVPFSFVVPADGDNLWPEETWGMRLGVTMSHMRNGNMNDHLHQLESMGFYDFDPPLVKVDGFASTRKHESSAPYVAGLCESE